MDTSAKKNIDLAVVLHDDCDYKDWLVELKERFYSHRLKASCATNGYLLDFYWKLGRDIEAKQYTNTYGSGFYKNLSQDLKNEMPGVKGFSPTNLKYMSYFYKLYAPLQANCPQLADNFIEDLYIADIQRVVAQSKNRPQTADDFKLLFLIPWDHHRRIIDNLKSFGKSLESWYSDIDNPTIGLLICKDKDNVVAKYALESYKEPMGISEYQLSKLFPKDFKSSMPTIEELEKGLKDN